MLKLSSELTLEQQRHIRENLSKEELVLFDILTRPAPPELSADERKKVKQVARALLPKLKELLVLNWRRRTAATSKLRMCIEDVLDRGLPRAYTKELYLEKVAALYEHMYDSYAERDENVYAEGGVAGKV